MEEMKLGHKKKVLTPKLRFKGYSDEWKLKKLGELLEFKNGINASKEQYGKGYKFINVLDILNNEYITHDCIIGSVEIDEKTFLNYPVNYGDILFQRSSETREEVGTACVYLDKNKTATFGGFVIRGKKIGEYEPMFLNKLLKTDLSRNEITSKSGGSTRYNVGQETLSSVTLPFPTLQEQQKIASFLSTVDEKIQLLDSKKQLLEQYKKGVMQQLFSGKLRFKDENGKAYPKWEVKKLGDMLSFVVDNRGKTPPITNKGYPMIEINAIGKNRVDYTVVEKFVSQEVYDTWFRKYLEPGDVLFSTVGATALCSIYDSDRIAVIAQNLVGLRFTSENELFMFYLLTEDRNNHKFKRIEMGAVQPSVKVSQMIHVDFKVPCLEEQKKIADFLSAMDVKIESLSKQITQTQNFKKGLLQQMFV